MANIDRILNMHQSYSLMKNSAINRQILISQYAQCEEISNLERDIQRTTSISRRILENQLKEFQHRESLKYYKQLAYNMNEAASLIIDEKDPVMQSFMANLYLEIMIANVKEAKEHLEEIPDKNYCKGIENKLDEFSEIITPKLSLYQESNFPKYFSCKNDYAEKEPLIIRYKQENIAQQDFLEKKYRRCLMLLPPSKSSLGLVVIFLSVVLVLMLLGCISLGNIKYLPVCLFISLLLGVFILVDRKQKKGYPQRLASDQTSIEKDKNKLRIQIDVLASELAKEEDEFKHHPYKELQEKLLIEYPNWEEKIECIYSYMPKEQIEGKSIRRDDMYEDAARLIVIHQQGSTSLIQRKFSIGYNRAGRIMNQLERAGVVGPSNGSKPRQVLCGTEDELKTALGRNKNK